MRIEERSDADFGAFWEPVGIELARTRCLQRAAQTFCERFYAEFAESAALVRVFATLPFSLLPAAENAFARAAAERAGQAALLEPATPVLTLLGTCGVEPAWRERRESRGHLAIPLLSDDVVAEIPMIARLLREIGFPALRSGPADWQFVKRLGGSDGLFFVGDAQTTTDENGRRIIPASDFVERYAIKTVFGFGGPLAGSIFLSAIVFCRQALMRSNAVRFVPLMEKLRAATEGALRARAIFAS